MLDFFQAELNLEILRRNRLERVPQLVGYGRIGDSQEFIFCVDLFVQYLLGYVNDLDHYSFHSIFDVLLLVHIKETRPHIVFRGPNNLKIHGVKFEGFVAE